jgi:PAS domain-containing protein
MPITICRGEHMSIQYANQKALSLITNINSKFHGTSISEIFPEAFPEEVITQIWRECFGDGKTTHTKSRRFIQFGQENTTELWFDITSQPIRDRFKEVVGVISYFTDVTDKLNNKKVFAGEHHPRELFKNAPVGIVCYRGEEFIVYFANDKALEMWGTTSAEVEGRKVDEIFPEVKTDPTRVSVMPNLSWK